MPRTFFVQGIVRKSLYQSFNYHSNNHVTLNNTKINNIYNKRGFFREAEWIIEKSFGKESRQAIKEFLTEDLENKYVIQVRKNFEQNSQKNHIDENYTKGSSDFYFNEFRRITYVRSRLPDKNNKKLHEVSERMNNFIREGLSLTERAIYDVSYSYNGRHALVPHIYPDSRSEKNDIEGIKKLQLVLSVFAVLARQNKIQIYVRDEILDDEISSSNFFAWSADTHGMYINSTKKLLPVVILKSQFNKETLFHECTHVVDDFLGGLCKSKFEIRINSTTKWINQTVFAPNSKVQLPFIKKENVSLDEAVRKDLLIEKRRELVGDNWIKGPVYELERYYTPSFSDQLAPSEIKAEYVALLSKYPYSIMKSCWPNVTAWFKTIFFPKCEAFLKENDIELYNAIISNPEITLNSDDQQVNEMPQLKI